MRSYDRAPSHPTRRSASRPLERLFRPRGVAVVGASADPVKVGHAILNNLVASGYPGAILPVHPRLDRVLGLPAYPDVVAAAAAARGAGTPVDLAVLAVPAEAVPEAVTACGQAGVGYAAVITAGFGETGPEGARLEAEVVRRARRAEVRLLGPNSLGLLSAATPLNTLFTAGQPAAGPVAFVSQSGAVWAAMLDWSLARGVGFSHFVSLGNRADLDEADILDGLAGDPETRVICLYLEGVGEGPRLVRALRRATRTVQVAVLKAGTGREGARAAASHTGALAGSDRAFDAALRHVGAHRAGSLEELLDLAVALAARPFPRGDRVAVLTNAGGPGILATDQVEREGLRMARPAPSTAAALRQRLPAAAAVGNPVDLLAEADAARYRLALDGLGSDPGVDAVVAVLLPGARADPGAVAETLTAWRARHPRVPVFAALTGGDSVARAVAALGAAGVPCFPSPERAVRALAGAVRHSGRRAGPGVRAPGRTWTFPDVRPDLVRRVLRAARAEGRTALVGAEAALVARAYGIPAAPSMAATSATAAVAAAAVLGYPVVLKVASPRLLHRTDAGGVLLGLDGPEAVREGFRRLTTRMREAMPDDPDWDLEVQAQAAPGRECIAGMVRDPQFGPLVMAGLGGIYAELLEDTSLRPAAGLTRADVPAMLDETRAGRLLDGLRGQPPADRAAVAEVVGRLAQLARDFPAIASADLNPLLAYEHGALAVDVKIVLAPGRRVRGTTQPPTPGAFARVRPTPGPPCAAG